MILGIGNDLIDVVRIKNAITQHPRFLERVFTEAERAAIAKKGAETAAGYFAAKEAVAKALGTGFSGFSACDISIEPNESGKPLARLTGGALKRMVDMRGCVMHVSITHDSGFASAVAILEG